MVQGGFYPFTANRVRKVVASDNQVVNQSPDSGALMGIVEPPHVDLNETAATALHPPVQQTCGGLHVSPEMDATVGLRARGKGEIIAEF